MRESKGMRPVPTLREGHEVNVKEGLGLYLRSDNVPSEIICQLVRVQERRERAVMIQLAGCQVAQVSQGGKIDICLGCDEEVYADLHATGSGLALSDDHPVKHLVSLLEMPPMQHRGLSQHWLR